MPLQQYRNYRKMSGGKAAALLIAAALLAVLVSLGGWLVISTISKGEERQERYDELIEQAGRRNGVDPDLIRAVIWRESNFDRRKIGGKGEIGLMQIMPSAGAAEWARVNKRSVPGKAQLSDPALNIEIGSWILGRAMKRWSGYKDRIALALCEYNAGFSRANAWKPPNPSGSVFERIKIDSTKKYASDIIRQYAEYRMEKAKRKEKESGRRK